MCLSLNLLIFIWDHCDTTHHFPTSLYVGNHIGHQAPLPYYMEIMLCSPSLVSWMGCLAAVQHAIAYWAGHRHRAVLTNSVAWRIQYGIILTIWCGDYWIACLPGRFSIWVILPIWSRGPPMLLSKSLRSVQWYLFFFNNHITLLYIGF
jgi:hypothetical protein